jgi:glutamate formiminotransferase / formiminotetrahydrofolate cyclodeaminase
MQKIVECVPNFSEGRDLAVIKQITDEIEKVEGANLLDVDPGADTNRTVVTIVGAPDAVVEAAFRAIKKASEVIDMRLHTGAHPRMGATDVCPFIPVSNITMDECVELAKTLGKRVGDELEIPVYLYEYAASKPEWKNLANVRKGEYEGLYARFDDAYWKPDFGPAKFNASSGATAISARKFLVAYNVNLNTRDTKKATGIALDIREQGRGKRDGNGKIMKNADGTKMMTPGTLKSVKAVGWYIDEYNMAQVSINLTDTDITPIHIAFDEVCCQAEKRGLRVSGSEIVGMVPLKAMTDAGKYYLAKQNKSKGASTHELVRLAIQSMGLDEISPFIPDERIIEFRLAGDAQTNQLVTMKLNEFNDELASDSPAPGGGSVSALVSSMSVSLTAMVGLLTHGKKGYNDVWEEVERLGEDAQSLKDQLQFLVDVDTQSFNDVMSAMRLAKKTSTQIETRNEAIEMATKISANVPFKVMQLSFEAMKLARRMSQIGNQNSLSDAGVALLIAYAGFRGAAMNVQINLGDIQDKIFVSEMTTNVHQLKNDALTLYSQGLDDIEGKLAL